jgi:hypothetical protein
MNMKTNNQHQSPTTYALLMRSEEKERGLSETLITALLIGSAVFSIWHAATQPLALPITHLRFAPAIAHTAAVQQPGA